jgi:hypothetical protein
MWRNADLDGLMAAQTQNRRRKNGLGNTIITPLHKKLEGNDRKGVLTRAELSSVVTLSVEADKWLEEEEIPQAWFSNCTIIGQA